MLDITHQLYSRHDHPFIVAASPAPLLLVLLLELSSWCSTPGAKNNLLLIVVFVLVFLLMINDSFKIMNGNKI